MISTHDRGVSVSGCSFGSDFGSAGLGGKPCTPDGPPGTPDGPPGAVDVPLWTAEEGRSDLTLSLTVHDRDGSVEIAVDDLRVL